MNEKELREAWLTVDCQFCDNKRKDWLYGLTGDFADKLSSRMIVCPSCGNKRCPKATHHDNPCTNSNEPNQEGSSYQTYKGPRLTIEEMLAKLDEED